MRKPEETRPILLRCTCGTMLDAIRTGGESNVFAQRACDKCKRKWKIRLDIASWSERPLTRIKVPSYKIGEISHS